MDISDLIEGATANPRTRVDGGQLPHPYPTRHSHLPHPVHPHLLHTPQAPTRYPDEPMSQKSPPTETKPYPSPTRPQKQVTFVLLMTEGERHQALNRARLPLRIMISPHDSAEGIVTTVKNFWGLYYVSGLIFHAEHDSQNILIASYDNFHHNMTVHVTIPSPEPAIVPPNLRSRSTTTSPRKPKLGAAFEMRPPQITSRPPSRAASRPASRNARPRSLSPQSIKTHGNASSAAAAAAKARLSTQKSMDHDPHAEACSDSDGGNGSVTSSRREAHVSAEISVDNIVEGGRRKRAKFDSSELPLFVPPQVPAPNSMSSLSPQRRANGEVAASPYSWANNQRTFSYQQPLPSPQSYSRPENAHSQHSGYLPYIGPTRGAGPITYGPPRQSTGGILPTPEPTACSTISDEDVALQLMRLGDASNFSYGRTSTSTMDDALSGKADAASSGEDSEDLDNNLPASKSHASASVIGPRRKKQRVHDRHLDSTDSAHSDADEYDGRMFEAEINNTSAAEFLGTSPQDGRRMSKSKASGSSNRDSGVALPNGSANGHPPGLSKSKQRTTSVAKVPMSPASLPAPSRKTSSASTINFQSQYGVDEEDLSSKPRCQRCRKSKKGCDRQRPCGRCKDAGIGADGCVSEDEGNGRKGRYGRHMGVPLKKDAEIASSSTPIVSGGEFLTPALPLDKSKKRKR